MTFTRDGILQAVAQFVACDDQVSKMKTLNNERYSRMRTEGFRRCRQ
jgi:hypothetical protein